MTDKPQVIDRVRIFEDNIIKTYSESVMKSYNLFLIIMTPIAFDPMTCLLINSQS
jgi:hypothetical protein